MPFNSIEFHVFLPIVLGFYYCLSFKAQNIFLLIASYVFCGFWDFRFLFLIATSTAVDFFVGLALFQANVQSVRKRLLLLSVVTNLGILGFFKYFNFFIQSMKVLLLLLGVETNGVTLEILLPVGISFYTLQTLSYTIDIYRRRIAPTNNFITFALFVAFFPQLVGDLLSARSIYFLPLPHHVL